MVKYLQWTSYESLYVVGGYSKGWEHRLSNVEAKLEVS